MKSTTTITINTEILAQFKAKTQNVSGRIEELIKADLQIQSYEPKEQNKAKQLIEVQNTMAKVETERAAFTAQLDSLKKKEQALKQELDKKEQGVKWL